jgi:DnaJ like chaperone protein
MGLGFFGALIGAISNGFPGLLVGGLIGYGASIALRKMLGAGLRVGQSQLIDSTFSVMGAMCKADNVVTRAEIQTVEKVFHLFNLRGEQKQQAKAAFNRGKQPDFDLDAAVDKFARLTRGRGPLLQLFLQVQCMAIAADGRVHPAEHAMLVRIARKLGLGEADVAQLEALVRASTGSRSDRSAPPSQGRLADAYAALGVTPDTGPAEIKRAYRKLISKNHPDKLASRGLPESMRGVAEERSREINSAYDLIKSATKDVQ